MMITEKITPGSSPELPLREDGTPWPFVLVSTSEEVQLLSDTLTELVSFFVDTAHEGRHDVGPYLSMSDDEAAAARHGFMVGLSAIVQNALVAGLLDERGPDALQEMGMNEEELTVLMNKAPDIAADLSASTWDYGIPLVIVATHYAPYRPNLKAPTSGEGDVIVLDPSNERRFLESLCGVGLITTFHVADSDAVDADAQVDALDAALGRDVEPEEQA